MTEEELARGLAALGYRVEDEEMRQLAEQVGPGGPGTGGVRKSAFVASQLDWPALQSDFRCAPPARVVAPVHTCVARETLPCLRLRHTSSPVHKCARVGLLRASLAPLELDKEVLEALQDPAFGLLLVPKLPWFAGMPMAGWAAAGASGWRRRGACLRAWRAARRAAWRRASWSRAWPPSCQPPRSTGLWRTRCWRPGSEVHRPLLCVMKAPVHDNFNVCFSRLGSVVSTATMQLVLLSTETDTVESSLYAHRRQP